MRATIKKIDHWRLRRDDISHRSIRDCSGCSPLGLAAFVRVVIILTQSAKGLQKPSDYPRRQDAPRSLDRQNGPARKCSVIAPLPGRPQASCSSDFSLSKADHSTHRNDWAAADWLDLLIQGSIDADDCCERRATISRCASRLHSLGQPSVIEVRTQAPTT